MLGLLVVTTKEIRLLNERVVSSNNWANNVVTRTNFWPRQVVKNKSQTHLMLLLAGTWTLLHRIRWGYEKLIVYALRFPHWLLSFSIAGQRETFSLIDSSHSSLRCSSRHRRDVRSSVFPVFHVNGLWRTRPPDSCWKLEFAIAVHWLERSILYVPAVSGPNQTSIILLRLTKAGWRRRERPKRLSIALISFLINRIRLFIKDSFIKKQHW